MPKFDEVVNKQKKGIQLVIVVCIREMCQIVLGFGEPGGILREKYVSPV
jgi:hypothetical protein